MCSQDPTQVHATGFIHTPDDKGRPITAIGTNSIRPESTPRVASRRSMPTARPG